MKINKLQIASIVLLILISIVTFVLYRSLPEQIPVHWTVGGNPDKFTTRFLGAFSLLILIAVIFAAWVLISKLISIKRNYYNIFFFLLTLAMIIVQALALLWNLGYKFDISYYGAAIGGIAIGIISISLGFFLKTTKEKIHASIHVGPWGLSNEALSNDRIRKKTNSITGTVLEILGIILVVSSFFPKLQNLAFNITLWGVISIVIFTYAYSSFLYKKEVNKDEKV